MGDFSLSTQGSLGYVIKTSYSPSSNQMTGRELFYSQGKKENSFPFSNILLLFFFPLMGKWEDFFVNPIIDKKYTHPEPGMVACGFNPSSWEREAGISQWVQGQSGLQSVPGQPEAHRDTLFQKKKKKGSYPHPQNLWIWYVIEQREIQVAGTVMVVNQMTLE